MDRRARVELFAEIRAGVSERSRDDQGRQPGMFVTLWVLLSTLEHWVGDRSAWQRLSAILHRLALTNCRRCELVSDGDFRHGLLIDNSEPPRLVPPPRGRRWPNSSLQISVSGMEPQQFESAGSLGRGVSRVTTGSKRDSRSLYRACNNFAPCRPGHSRGASGKAGPHTGPSRQSQTSIPVQCVGRRSRGCRD